MARVLDINLRTDAAVQTASKLSAGRLERVVWGHGLDDF